MSEWHYADFLRVHRQRRTGTAPDGACAASIMRQDRPRMPNRHATYLFGRSADTTPVQLAMGAALADRNTAPPQDADG